MVLVVFTVSELGTVGSFVSMANTLEETVVPSTDPSFGVKRIYTVVSSVSGRFASTFHAKERLTDPSESVSMLAIFPVDVVTVPSPLVSVATPMVDDTHVLLSTECSTISDVILLSTSAIVVVTVTTDGDVWDGYI